MTTLRTLSPIQARRLAILRQRLAGERPRANAGGILEVIRDLGCVQLDPISAVARSHLIVLWSRLGLYDPTCLDTLLWQERKLFEYWAHCASIVLTEDYPIHNALMRNYAQGDSAFARRVRTWLEDNAELKRNVLAMIRRKGPLLSRGLIEVGGKKMGWVSTGWTSGHTTSRLLDFLWLSGTIMVAGRDGIQKKWDLAKRFLPEWTPREKWSEHQIVHHAAQKSLRALGVATPRHIEQHFIRGRYPNLANVLKQFENEQLVERVQIVENKIPWKGDWYIHTADLALLDRLGQTWQPRTTLLSPFDNLICDRARTKQFFNFDFTMEIYVPKDKRKYGYYVLPILHGDQLIGRIDAASNRAESKLLINAIYAEPNAPARAASGIAKSIGGLADFVGAQDIVFTRNVPHMWRQIL
ncbi:MAG: YcaQ family DNA glycosylase [Chloroflexi bacterium]|nr:YcaQ family DNA glycosylase [Chloroflexota bacterium]